MKASKQLATVLLVAVGFLLSACSDKENAYLRLSSTSCAFNAAGGDQTITVGTDGSEWNMAVEGGNADWFTVTKQVDGILVHAPLNTTDQVKIASIVISGSIPATINVIQAAGVVPTLALIPADEQYGLTFDGGSVTIAVSSNYAWTASCKEAWCKVSTDMKSNTLTLSAGQGSGEKRTAIVIVTTGPEGSADTKTLTITQYTMAEHPYLSLLGDWDLYCDKWSYGGAEDAGAGMHAIFTLSQGVMNETYLLTGQFSGKREAEFIPIKLEIYFDPDNASIGFPLGWKVGEYVGGASTYNCYLNEVNMVTNHTQPGYVTSTVSSDRKTIRLGGITESYGIGIVGDDGSQRVKFGFIYYATGKVMELRFRETTSSIVNSCFVIPKNTATTTRSRAVFNEGTLLRDAVVR